MRKLIPYAIMVAYIITHTVLLLNLPIWRQMLATLMVAVPLSLLANFAAEVGGWRALMDIILCRNNCTDCNGTGQILEYAGDDNVENMTARKCCKCNGTGLKHYKGDS